MSEGMSDYEKMRLANIARNEAALAQLEIPQLPRESETKRKTGVKRNKRAMATPGRRSSRIAAAPRRSMKDSADQQEDGSDYEADAGGDDDTDEEYAEEEHSQPRKRIRSTAAAGRPAGTTQPSVPPPAATAETTVVTVELAKTGRSKCRACFEPITAGSPRVGMMAWMMGRQSMTWSHPQCCINRLVVAVETSGRGKCKVTGAPLPKGLPKIGVRSHTATSWIALPRCASVLAPVLQIVPDMERDRVQKLLGADGSAPAVEGFSNLSDAHAETVRKALQDACSATGARTASKAESTTPPQSSQGSGDTKKLTGRVAWKFGGLTCYGRMIADRETSTHCYATTHKGNIKTLKKGSQHWWMVHDR